MLFIMYDVMINGSVVFLLSDIVMYWCVIFGVIIMVCDYLSLFFLFVGICCFFVKVRNNIGDVWLLNEGLFFLLSIMVGEDGMF